MNRRRLSRLRDRLGRVVIEKLLRTSLAAVIDHRRLLIPLYLGDPGRVHLGANVELNNATLNTMSGTIRIGDESFCGTGVTLATGTHDPALRGKARRQAWPSSGRDILIGRGVWLATNCTVLGPCVIGDDAVVAAGAVVTGDVPARTIVAGVPARFVRSIP